MLIIINCGNLFKNNFGYRIAPPPSFVPPSFNFNFNLLFQVVSYESPRGGITVVTENGRETQSNLIIRLQYIMIIIIKIMIIMMIIVIIITRLSAMEVSP